jgi:transposase
MARRTVSAKELAYYRANFREAIREDGVVCLECGALRHSLGRHVSWHGLTPDEYREKWGYNRETALITPALREVRRQQALARNLAALAPPHSMQAALEVRRRSRWSLRPESRLACQARGRARAEAGWFPPATPSRVDDDTLRSFVQEGLTARQIGARTGLHRRTVRARVRALGLVTASSPPDRRRVPDAELLAFRQAGLIIREIATRTGMTVANVEYRLQQLRKRGVAVPASPHSRRLADDQLLPLARAGLSGAAIAARLGLLHGSSVRRRIRALRKQGLLPAASRPSAPTISRAELLALHQAGLSPREIADRTGLPVAAIRNRLARLRRRGIIRSATTRVRPVSDEVLLALAREGLWSSEIAARVGISTSGVQARLARLRKRGVDVPRPAGRVPNPGRRVTDEQLLSLAGAGLSRAEIASRAGISPATVKDRLSRLRKRGLLPPAPARGQARKPVPAPRPDPS